MAFLFLQLGSQLNAATRHFTFNWLRNLLVRTVVEREHPETLDESEAATARIRNESFVQCVARALVGTVSDSQVREVLLRLQGLTIGELRNDVVHEDANLPLLAEVERCRLDEIELLYDAKHLLDVRTFEAQQAVQPPSKPCRPHRCDSVVVLVGGCQTGVEKADANAAWQRFP